LVDLQPDAILANSTPATAAFQRVTQTIPIVFMTDRFRPGGIRFRYQPAAAGRQLDRFQQPRILNGGKVAGIADADRAWHQAHRNAPQCTAMMFNPEMSPYVRSYYLPFLEASARSLKVEPILAPVRSKAEIETVIASLGREPEGSIIVMPDAFLNVHRALTISLRVRVVHLFTPPAVSKQGQGSTA
jgi:putative tryptophan/tyrosine transport system substrate-binding protein